MQPYVRSNAPGYFGVAIEALERALSGGEFVARSAVRYAIDRLVRARQRARRNLSGSRNQCPYNCQNDPLQKSCLRESANAHSEARI